MSIITISIVYLHHKEVDKYYHDELKKNINIDLVTGNGSSEEIIEPEINNNVKQVGEEDELIV